MEPIQNPLLRLNNAAAAPFLRLTTDAPAIEAPMVLDARVIAGTGGGPDKTILRSAKHHDPARIRMAAAYIHPTDDTGIITIRELAQRFGCPLYEIPESGPLDPRTVRSLLQLCKKLRVTIWHGHDYKTNALGLLLRRFWPMKLVTTVHGWTHETTRTRLYYHVDNLCIHRYDHVIAVSPTLREHCLKHGVSVRRLSYIPNAIDVTEYRRDSDGRQKRTELEIGRDKLVIGCVGRLSAEKGLDRAVKLLAELLPKFPDAELHLVGEGPERDAIECLAVTLGVDKQVRFHGYQAASQRFYEMLDVLLLPSRTEGMPNVVLEAMAMGVAVAATDVGGVKELLEGGRCGVVLGDNDAMWAEAIAPLLVSPVIRSEYTHRARHRVEKHFSFKRRMEQVMAVYDDVLRIRRPATLPVEGDATERRKAA